MNRFKNEISCVYKIGFGTKWYVGSTKYFKKRKQEHFYNLKKGIHPNKNLQNTFNNYPIVMEIIEVCEEENLRSVEQKYMNLFLEDNNITVLNIYKDSKSPPFSSVYITQNILPNQIIFEEINKKDL